ncbi:unnamed protein product [Onchocerca flexuosa]|uniref:BRCT domain-containing protein n=1 Tax=Onchocerca flexuosa TaxID=387005 RepID=A0A183HDH5_9BILA|nr:unnamed protein product [Onchocerca flexuosa]
MIYPRWLEERVGLDFRRFSLRCPGQSSSGRVSHNVQRLCYDAETIYSIKNMADVAVQMKEEEQKKIATDDTSSGSSGNEAGDENEMKGSDNENDENEGEVTEAQKKVAEAAGLADQF